LSEPAEVGSNETFHQQRNKIADLSIGEVRDRAFDRGVDLSRGVLVARNETLPKLP